TPRFRPDPSEVAGIVQWPLHRLLDGGSIRTEHPRGARPAWRTIPYFEAEGHRVWGATAMILSELRVLLRRPA
ncbi:MAG: hypothetical protein R3202_11465, partial [Candidatus Competibacterales bacterium]|nr:hypothetical protein [Candidatus Competibacterales bacterium]